MVVDFSRHLPIISEIKVLKYLSMRHKKWVGHVWLAVDVLQNPSVVVPECSVYYVVEAIR